MQKCFEKKDVVCTFGDDYAIDFDSDLPTRGNTIDAYIWIFGVAKDLFIFDEPLVWIGHISIDLSGFERVAHQGLESLHESCHRGLPPHRESVPGQQSSPSLLMFLGKSSLCLMQQNQSFGPFRALRWSSKNQQVRKMLGL